MKGGIKRHYTAELVSESKVTSFCRFRLLQDRINFVSVISALLCVANSTKLWFMSRPRVIKAFACPTSKWSNFRSKLNFCVFMSVRSVVSGFMMSLPRFHLHEAVRCRLLPKELELSWHCPRAQWIGPPGRLRRQSRRLSVWLQSARIRPWELLPKI